MREEEGYPRIVIFALHIQKTFINYWPGVVEFGDVCVFQPIHKHLAPENHKEWTHHLPRPAGEDSEAFWQDSAPGALAGRERPYPQFHQISRGDDQEHQPQLETLHDVRAEQLKKVLLFKFLEHSGFNLDELDRQK